MKRMITIGIVCVALCRVICNGAEVTIAGDDYPLVFRDTTVNTNNQERIASDLTLALAYIDSITNAFDFIITDEYGNSYFEQPSESCSELVRFLRFDTNLPCKLVVEKELSDKYIAQFAKVDPYTNIVAQVDSFIEQFHSGAVTNLAVAEQRALMVETKNVTVDYPDYAVREIMGEYVKVHFYPPSILEFELITFKSTRQTYPIVVVAYRSEYKSRPVTHSALLIYYNDAWRLLGITD